MPRGLTLKELEQMYERIETHRREAEQRRDYADYELAKYSAMEAWLRYEIAKHNAP